MMHARERLYLTADKATVVGEGHPKAAFLYAAQGDEIPASAAERFGLVDGRLKPARPARHATLLGSSVLPAMIAITAELSVQLGQVVAEAHKASGLSVEDWNALPDADREARLGTTIEVMRADPPAPPAPKATRAKAPAKAKPKAAKEQAPAPTKEQKPGENKGG